MRARVRVRVREQLMARSRGRSARGQQGPLRGQVARLLVIELKVVLVGLAVAEIEAEAQQPGLHAQRLGADGKVAGRRGHRALDITTRPPLGAERSRTSCARHVGLAALVCPAGAP